MAGSRVVLDHVDRIVVRDLTSGASLLEIDEPLTNPDLLTVSADGQVAYLVRRYRPQRILIAGFRLDTGAPLADLNLTYPWTFLSSTDFELVLNDDGSRLMVPATDVFGRQVLRIFDTATGAQLTDLRLAERDAVGDAQAFFLANGEDFAAIRAPLQQLPELVAFDGSTGLETASVQLPGDVYANTAGSFDGGSPRFGLRTDKGKTRVVVRTRTDVAAPIEFHAWSLPGLLPQGVPITANSTEFRDRWTTNAAADRVFGTGANSLVRGDLTTGQVSAIAPIANSDSTFALTQGGIVMFDRAGQLSILDPSTGALQAILENPLGTPEPNGSAAFLKVSASPGSQTLIVRRPSASRYAVFRIDGVLSETVNVFPDGRSTDADPPFHLAQGPSADELLVASESANNLRRVVDGLETDFLVVGAGPTEVIMMPDGLHAVVRCADAASLQLVRLTDFTVVDEISFVEDVRELDLQGGRLWVWVNLPGPSLLGFDVSSGTLQQIAQIGLADVDQPDDMRLQIRESVVVDEARAVAYVLSGSTGVLQRIDLGAGVVNATLDLQESQVRPHLTLNSAGTSLVANLRHGNGVRLMHVPDPFSSLSPSWRFTYSELQAPGAAAFVSDEIVYVPDLRPRLIRATDGIPVGPILNIGPGSVNRVTTFGDVALLESGGSYQLWRVNGAIESRFTLSGGNATNRPLYNVGECLVFQGARDIDEGDGIRVVPCSVGSIAEVCSPAAQNSLGFQVALDLEGAPFADTTARVTARNLRPGGMPGYLVVGDAAGLGSNPPGAIGRLCVRGNLGRFVNQVQTADAAGMMRFVVDADALPLSMGLTSIQPGESWYYQLWYRDVFGGCRPRSSARR